MTTLVQQQSRQSYDIGTDYQSSDNVDKVVQSVTNVTKRLSQISTNTNNSTKKRKTQNRIGPWKLGRTLGRGSTGRVRLAKNINTGKLAAVKIVPKSNFRKLENPKYKRNSLNSKDRLPYGIEREIIIMKLISHPNIMGLYDVWENKNDLYLILEYIEGGELFDYLIKKGKLQEFEAINYFKQIINGINYLHQFNICHRDLKPENLLLDFNKNIKIADFGMAALEVREKLLETSCGSPHYASPEIVAGKNYHGAPSDIWSCGIILFALLTGHLPFDDENIRKLLLKVQKGKFIMPADLSWEAKDLISKMLKVDPNERITIDSILKHPLLTKYPEPSVPSSHPSSSKSTFDLTKITIKPIESIDKIDKEILKNLSVLFHNRSEQSIISKLLSPNKCPEKMFYYLLIKYRNEHTSSNLGYYDDETDMTGSDSKQTLPRSTSIVKTTIVDHITGEKHTTIKRVPKSSSIYSNKSIRTPRRDKVLSNITNTTPNNSIRNFKASNSFNRKKTLLNNQVISRNSSSKSLKKKVSSPQAPPVPPKLKRKLTGLMDLNEFNNDNNENDVQQQRLIGTFGNKSLLNFELICQEVFGDKDIGIKEDGLDYGTKIKQTPLPENNNSIRNIYSEEKSVQDFERMNIKDELAIRKKEDKRLKEEEEKIKQQKEKDEERRRQSIILQEKQRAALEKLKNHQSSNDFSDAKVSRRRYVTDPVRSSLDPKSTNNSLLRAKSLATSYASLKKNGLNDNTSKVLQKLGIEVIPSPPTKISSGLKTSSSKNLSGYLKISAKNEVDDYDYQDKENLTLDVFNKRERSNKSILKPNINNNKRLSNQSSLGYRSLLTDIHENSSQRNDNESIAPIIAEITSESILKSELIPNPRFSRFSIGGLLNPTKFENVGDLTIINSLASSGTVIKKNVDKSKRQSLKTVPGNGLIKKSSTSNLLGLGINMKQHEGRKASYSIGDSTTNNFVSVNLTDSTENDTMNNSTLQNNAISMNEGQYDDDTDNSDSTMLDDSEYSIEKIDSPNQNHHMSIMESDISNFDIISSRTADIGTIIKTRPSIVQHSDSSKETLIINDTKRKDESIKLMYKDYESLYKNSSSKPKKLIDINKPNLQPDNYEELESEERLDVSETKLSFNDNSNFNILNSTSIGENTIDEPDSDFAFEDTKRLERVLEPVNHEMKQQDYEKEAEHQPKEKENIQQEEIKEKESTSKGSRASTQIFSSVALNKLDGNKNKNVQINDKEEIIRSKSPISVEPLPVENTKNNNSLFRRLSIKPKREAPKAPHVIENASRGHNRFSRVSMGLSIGDEYEKEPRKENWFKKFIHSLSSSPKTGTKFRETNKNIHIINSNLTSVNLIGIIKYQLELKKIEGSISKVEIDEEFGLISGIIPSKYSHGGRKLKFKIEIIDLINSSSLHLIKIKGNEKGFQNLINIVNFIIKQEEQLTNNRKSNAYSFSGYKKN